MGIMNLTQLILRFFYDLKNNYFSEKGAYYFRVKWYFQTNMEWVEEVNLQWKIQNRNITREVLKDVLVHYLGV